MCFVFIWEQTATCATYSIIYRLSHCTVQKKCLILLTFQSLPVTWRTASVTFNNCTFCPHCIYVFCIYLRINSDLCHLQHKLIGFYNPDEKCLQRGTDWVFKYSGLRLGFKGLYLLTQVPSSVKYSSLYWYMIRLGISSHYHAFCTCKKRC